MTSPPDPRATPTSSRSDWEGLLDSLDLRAVLEQHPDLCRQLEEAIAREGPENSTSQSANELTTDHRPGAWPREEAALDAPLAGQFGDYELLEELGRGGMGVVYRARQRSLERLVAIKMILAGEFADESDLRRFRAEAHAAARLSHAHIVPIHEVGELHGRSYFSMALVEGPTLDQVLKLGPLPPENAAEIVRKIALAVAYAHQEGIIHRDLKPANILLDPQREPRIADFGLAKWRTGEATGERTGDIVGTPSYMAPEQAAGRVNDITEAADVYSLGAILYACLTGRPPFAEGAKLDTILAVLEREAPLPRRINRQVPRALECIVLRCLEKRPEDRYPSAAALADDLQRYLLGEPVEARRGALLPRLRRWARRRPTLIAHLAVLTLMVGAQHALHWTLGGNPDYLFHMTLLFAAWAIASGAFQWWLQRPAGAEFGRFAWAATDATLLTIALYLTGPPLSGLLVGYPALVVAAGLFFRVRLVVFMTLACLGGFAWLLYALPELRTPVYLPVYFVLGQVSVGSMVGYQVYRIRALGRYYHRDPAGERSHPG